MARYDWDNYSLTEEKKMVCVRGTSYTVAPSKWIPVLHPVCIGIDGDASFEFFSKDTDSMTPAMLAVF